MTYEDIVFAYNNRALDARTWDMISDRERVEFVLRMAGKPVAYRYWHDEFGCWHYDDADDRTIGVKSEPLFTTLRPCPECDAQIEAFRSAVVSRYLAFGNVEHIERVKAEAEAFANLKEAIRGHQ